MRIVLSLEPDASSPPSGEKATDQTEAEWPSRVCWSVPVAGFQRCIALSAELDASRLPSGENATDRTDHVCASRTCSSALYLSSTRGNWHI